MDEDWNSIYYMIILCTRKKKTMIENIHSGGQALRSPVSNMSRCLSVGWKKWSRVAHLQIRWVPTWKEHLKVTQKQVKSKIHLKSIPNTIQFDTKAIEKQIDISFQWGVSHGKFTEAQRSEFRKIRKFSWSLSLYFLSKIWRKKHG